MKREYDKYRVIECRYSIYQVSIRQSTGGRE